MIDPINHYSLTNPASIYDEEAMTALELAGRTTSKLNEVIKLVNGNYKDVREEMDALRLAITKAIESWLGDHPEDYTTINDYVTPEIFGGVGDGATDSTDALKMAVIAGNVNLHGKSYVISDTIPLDSVIYDGTIIYKGPYNTDIFKMWNGGGLHNVKVVIKTANFSGNVVMADYTAFEEQFNPMVFTIDGLHVDNTITSGFVDPSTVIRIRIHKFQVIYGQNISNVRLDGYMEYGIYIEPILRNTSDNPVFNTAMFTNIFFNRCNCALKVYPVLAEGNVEDCAGGVGLLLVQFANQHHDSITKPFMEIHNTAVDGDMVIPWDYYGDNIPEDGIYVLTGSSKILLNRDFFPDNSTDTNVRYPWTIRSTGEGYSNLYCTKLEDVADNSPLRRTGVNWGVYNMKAIEFKPTKWNKYGNIYTGFQFQRDNANDPYGNKTIQIGCAGSEIFYVRRYNNDTGWGQMKRIYGEGAVPQQYAGKRSAGFAVGDMKFDTSKNIPMWWNGETWQSADGTVTVAVDYTETE